MKNFVDKESGVTVEDLPYIELDFEASNLTTETVPALDPQAVPQDSPVDPENAPHFGMARFPAFWSSQPPVILGNPAPTLLPNSLLQSVMP